MSNGSGWSKRVTIHPSRLIVLVLMVYLLRRVWILPVFIHGSSMLPTCQNGQMMLVNRLAYFFQQPRRGDLVCLWTGQEYFTKRIIGLPGEVIAIQNGVVNVNGQPLPEPYVQGPCHWNVGPGTLGAAHYVVVGDNRSMPQPRAVLAVVKRERIIGRLIRG